MAATHQQVQAIQGILATCTAVETAEIFKVLQSTHNQAPHVVNSMTTQRVAKTATKQRNKKAKLDNQTGGPKRPLNSWMAFRSQ